MPHEPGHVQQGTVISGGVQPETPAQLCRRQGGKWDAKNQVCIPAGVKQIEETIRSGKEFLQRQPEAFGGGIDPATGEREPTLERRDFVGKGTKPITITTTPEIRLRAVEKSRARAGLPQLTSQERTALGFQQDPEQLGTIKELQALKEGPLTTEAPETLPTTITDEQASTLTDEQALALTDEQEQAATPLINPEEFQLADDLSLFERGNLPASAFITMPDGKIRVIPEEQRSKLSPFGAFVIGGITGGAFSGLTLPSFKAIWAKLIVTRQVAVKTAVTKNTATAGLSTNIVSRSLAKAGLGGKLGATLKIGASLYGINKIVGTPDAIIRSADTSMSQIRETISAYPASVKNGAISPSDAIIGLNELDQQVLDLEAAIKFWSTFSISAKTNPNFTLPMTIRANKLHLFIDAAKEDILVIAANPENPQLTELNNILTEIEAEPNSFNTDLFTPTGKAEETPTVF